MACNMNREETQEQGSVVSTPMRSVVDLFRNAVHKGMSSSSNEHSAEASRVPESTECEGEMKQVQEMVYDIIRDVRDPEKPETLEELSVVSEEGVHVMRLGEGQLMITITFVPTVPHCSLASIIGLSLRTKLERCLPEKHKLDIFIKEGTHSTADEINKQINDKERIAAAMENPNLRELVTRCTDDNEG